MNNLKRHSSGIIPQAKGECPNRVHLDQIVAGTVRQEEGSGKRQPKALETKLTQGGTIRMVPVMVRREAGCLERRPETLKGELENNSRKARDQVLNLAK